MTNPRQLFAASCFTIVLVFALPCSAGTKEDPAPEEQVGGAVERAVAALLEMQEGEGGAEWPYEGVYRVRPYEEDFEGRRQIPIGYRVGGTAIVATALALAPGLEEDAARLEAIERAARFVIDSVDHALMDPDYQGGYDVRGWGYVYALEFLLLLEREELLPRALAKGGRRAIGHFVDALEEIEIPESGGWNYARAKSLDEPSATSPFMTGPAVQTLLVAKRQGHSVPAKLLERSLAALERGRLETGEVVYRTSLDASHRGGQLPGSVGRMLVTENTLYLADRGSVDRVRGALDAFFVHWDWLDVRRAQDGTHVAPYGVAPYYFYYAHFQAAQAVQLLPPQAREPYEERLRELLFRVRTEDGTWNDRVFSRTANYGTAMALRAFTMDGGSAEEEEER